MKIKILGTAAAEGVPALFCSCDTCKKSRTAGGRNIRSRSSILIDSILKIDLPPDTFHHTVVHGMNTAELRYLLITHSHHDHFAKSELLYLKSGFATRENLPELQIYGNSDVINMIQKHDNMKCRKLEPFQTFRAGEYKITTLHAKHGIDATPLNYIIEKNRKTLLYTCDTGYYDKTTWDFLASSGIKVDMVISECTGGINKANYKLHMGLSDVCEFRRKAEDIRITDTETPWILTHFTHNNKTTYDEFRPIAEAEAFQTAYDGMKLNL